MSDEGSIRGGRFVVLRPLGEGAQGRTFDGVDKREGRPVAIKRFDVRGAKAWKDVELAEREARVLASLSHPKLPAYVDHFEEDGALYLVMEKIEGESVASLRKRGERFSPDDVLRFLRDADDVLAYLHGRSPPIVHRDLKPGNVIRRPDGSFAFVDFGAVRDKLRPEGGSTVVGTFGFMAPEQFQARALPASDVYAVGATALAMLTGREPEDLPHQGLAIDVRGALRGVASERMIHVLERMLDPNPDARASRIAPLLEEAAKRKERGRDRDRRRDRDDVYERAIEDAFAHARERVQENMSKRQRRMQRRWEKRQERWQRRRRRFVPFPFSLILTLVFVAGTLALFLATQIVVPLVLRVLGAILGQRALAAAAARVEEGGRRGIEGLRRSRQWARGEEIDVVPVPEARVRVDEPEREVRVAEASDDDARDERDDEADEAPPEERRARRS